MSKCGYYSLYKGKLICKHPEKGELYTKGYGAKLYKRCDECRYLNGGIYPSEVPKNKDKN